MIATVNSGYTRIDGGVVRMETSHLSYRQRQPADFSVFSAFSSVAVSRNFPGLSLSRVTLMTTMTLIFNSSHSHFIFQQKQNKNPASLSSSTSFQPTMLPTSEVRFTEAGAPVHFRTILRFALVRCGLMTSTPTLRSNGAIRSKTVDSPLPSTGQPNGLSYGQMSLPR